MKILFLDQSGKLGGAELSLLDVACSFCSESSVSLFEDGPFRHRLESNGVKVQVLKNKAINSRKDSGFLQGISAVMNALPLIQEVANQAKNYEIIYANTQKAFILGALAGLMVGRPVVYHLRDILSLDHFSTVNIKVAVFVANHLSCLVIANSHATAQSFIQAGGKEELVKVIYNGFDSKVYQSNPDDRQRLRQELNLEDKFVVGHFSRFSPWNGQHVFLEALAQCPESVVGIFVGASLFGEDEYFEQIKQKVIDLGLVDRVQFLGFRSDVAELMQACDAVAHTSVTPEPFGRVIVEAMLSHRPIIAAAAGGAIELLESGKTGWLTEPDNAEELAKAIHSIQCNPEGAQSIVETAYNQASERFHIDNTNQQIKILLNSIE